MRKTDTQTSTTRRSFVGLLAALSIVLVALSPAGAQQQPVPPSNGGNSPGPPENGGSPIVNSWALSPGQGTPETAGRSNLSYELAPGTEANDTVTLYNLSNVALTFRLYATDGYNGDDGSFALLPGDQKPTDVGTWVGFPSEGVSLEAGHQATMPITVKVPPDARPGDHVGAVLAASSVPGTGPNGTVVNLDRRTGSRIYVRVAGPLEYKLSVENLSVKYHHALNPLGGSAEVTYQVVNRGNVRLAGSQQVEVSGPFGVFGKKATAQDVPELLPGQHMNVTTTINGVAATGLLTAHVKLTPKTVTGEAEQAPSSTTTAYTFAIPILLVAAVVIAFLIRFARKRYREHSEGPPASGPRERVDELV